MFNDPTGGAFKIATGKIFMKGEAQLDITQKRVPVKLESSACFLLAKLYHKTGRENDAKNQLDYLVQNGTLEALKQEMGEYDMPQYFWYPHQKALRILFDIAIKERSEKDAKK